MAKPNRKVPSRSGSDPRPAVPADSKRNARRVATVLAVCGLIVTATAAPAAAHAEYTVQSGDSLSVIARNHGVSASELAAENGVSDLHLIRVGQVLRIPHAEPTFYEVRSGDTIGGIANQVGVSRSALIAANGITDPNLIRVGQKLQVPDGGSVAPAEPADPAAGYNSLPGRLRENPDRLTLIPVFEQWAAHYGVPTDLLMAMAYRESGWQSGAISNKGAIGVGQLLPNTADWVARDLIKVPELDPYDPEDNIRMSARLLNWLVGFMGSEDAALAGYYQGPGSVAARGYFDDTQEYIDNVQAIRRLFVKG